MFHSLSRSCARNKMSSTPSTVPVVTTATKQTPEDAFYENLTLGIMKILSNIPRITNVVLEKRQPCERAHVATWEQRHNVYLPDDMKRFYLSTDGFTLHWCYQYSRKCRPFLPTKPIKSFKRFRRFFPNQADDTRRVGFLAFPHLIQITLLRENLETLITATLSSINTAPTAAKHFSAVQWHPPNLNSRSKIFEISNICELAKVCLVYETPESTNPRIYLLEVQTLKWHFLAETFTEYQRMSIAHLGLPFWELCFSTCGLPSWTEQLFLLLAPHLLEKSEPRRSRILPTGSTTASNGAALNQLDLSIFRTKPKGNRLIGGTKGSTNNKVNHH